MRGIQAEKALIDELSHLMDSDDVKVSLSSQKLMIVDLLTTMSCQSNETNQGLSSFLNRLYMFLDCVSMNEQLVKILQDHYQENYS